MSRRPNSTGFFTNQTSKLRIGARRDRFELRFRSPQVALSELIMPRGRAHLRFALESHLLMARADGRYSRRYLSTGQRWLRVAGGSMPSTDTGASVWESGPSV